MTRPTELAPWSPGRGAAAALAAATGLVLVTAVALLALALPADDDWMRAARWGFDRFGQGHAGLSWWDYVYGSIYLHWQGRWAACGTEAAVLPAIDPSRFYPLLVAALWAVDGACLAVVCRWFTRRGPWRQTAAVTAVAAAVVWDGLPSPAQAAYWFTGALENTTAVLLAAVVLTATAAMAAAAGRPNRAAAVGLAAGGFVVCGFHELYGGMLCLALGVGLATSRRRPAGWAWAAALAGATAGLAVVVLAPGNGRRAVHDVTPHPHQLAFAVDLSARLLWQYGWRWVLDPKLLAATAWVVASPWVVTARPGTPRPPWRWPAVAAGGVAVAVGFVGPCYAFGHVLPERTLSGVWLTFVAAWLLGAYGLTRACGTPARPAVSAAAAACLAVSLALAGNARWAVRDLAGPAGPWHAAQERRFAALRRAGVDHTAVSVPRLPPAPRLFLSGETSPDPAEWQNFSLAAYFGTGRLTLVDGPRLR